MSTEPGPSDTAAEKTVVEKTGALAPAQIRKSAATELRDLATSLLALKPLALTLLRVAQDPIGTGTPLGPCESVYCARIGDSNRVVVYTVDEYRTVTVEGFRKVVAL